MKKSIFSEIIDIGCSNLTIYDTKLTKIVIGLFEFPKNHPTMVVGHHKNLVEINIHFQILLNL